MEKEKWKPFIRSESKQNFKVILIDSILIQLVYKKQISSDIHILKRLYYVIFFLTYSHSLVLISDCLFSFIFYLYKEKINYSHSITIPINVDMFT
jgi:hypothetical protein